MSKPSLLLSPDPTFKSKVDIPIAGAKPFVVEFVFRHKSKDQLKEWLDSMQDKEDADAILEVASGWDQPDAFDRDSLVKLAQNRIGSVGAIIAKYISELADKRLGN